MAVEVIIHDLNNNTIQAIPGASYASPVDPGYNHVTDNASGMATTNLAFNDTTAEMTSDDSYMPLYIQAIIILMYSTITVASVGGNVSVIYIILAYQRMRTVTNYFIINLACGDMMMAVLCIPFNFVANVLMHYWPFGSAMCPVVSYSQGVSVFLSAFTLVAISVDRYIAVIKPLRPRMTEKQGFLIIGTIWILALSVPLPTAIKSRIIKINETDAVGICQEFWSEDQIFYRDTYTLLIMILQYFLPLFVLTFTYSKIAVVIWIQKPPGEAENNRDQRMAASKRKMVKMMIIVVIIYAFCWLPFHTITLIGERHPSIWGYQYSQVIWISCHWLAMSNCCYNPMVYCWMNSKFRNGFRYVLRFCPCVSYDYHEHRPSHKAQRVHTYVTTMGPSSFSSGGTTVCKYSGSVPGSGRNATRFRNTDYTPYCRRQMSNESIPLHNVRNGSSNKTVCSKPDGGYVSGLNEAERVSTRNDYGYMNNDRMATAAERTPLNINNMD